jgi:hypothetical protein
MTEPIGSVSIARRIVRHSGRALAVVAGYLVAYLAAGVAFLATNGAGIEGDPRDFPPYYAAASLVYAYALPRIWIAAIPAVHWYVVDPLWAQSTSDGGPVVYTFDRGAYVIAATAGIALGLLARAFRKRQKT